MFGDCDLCTEEDGKFGDRKPGSRAKLFGDRKPGSRAKLFGDFNVVACAECANAWHEFVTASDAWRKDLELVDAMNRVEIASFAGPRSDALAKNLGDERVRLNAAR